MRSVTGALVAALALVLAAPAMGQRRAELNTQASVDERVGSTLTLEKARGKLAQLAAVPDLRGDYTFDLTVGDKGQVLTVFPVGSTIESIPSRNRLKSCLMGLRFDFKVPKGKRFTTRQTLVFP